MQKLRAVHLFDKGSRYPHMISQGLLSHPDLSVALSKPFISFGNIVFNKSPDLLQDLLECDLIFRSGDLFYNHPAVDQFLTDTNLWKKVLYYDFKDSSTIDYHRLNICGAYYKRSWLEGIERKPLPDTDIPIMPLDYCVLDEYLSIDEPVEKDKNVVYLIRSDKKEAIRRYCVYLVLNAAKFPDSLIGSITMHGETGRRAIFAPKENNGFVEYIRMLKSAKIVFTAFPDMQDGDSRTWEAFASGGLVFMDTTGIPLRHPFVNQKHCIIFNALDQDSLFKAVDLARYYLEHEEERADIARAGKEYALSHHRPVNRIDQMIKWYFDSEKKLEKHVKI